MKKSKTLSKKDISMISRALSYIKNYKMKFIMLLLAIFTTILIGIIKPLLSGKVIENLSLKDYDNIRSCLIYLLIIYVANCFINFMKGYLESKISNGIIKDLRLEMYDKILNLSMSVFDKMKIGEFISRLQGDIYTVANIITGQLVNIIINIVNVLVLGFVIFKINWILALIVVISFPITYISFMLFGRKLRKENKKLISINDNYFTVMQQSLYGIKYIKTLGLKKANYNLFNKVSTTLRDKQVFIALITIISSNITMILTGINDIIILGVGAYFVKIGILSIQFYFAFTSYSYQFSQGIIALTSVNSDIQQMLSSLERIFDLLDNHNFSEEVFGSKELDNITGEITLENVYFSYEENVDILQDVGFKIKSNKLTVIVGENGCGKSTIFNIISGLYKVRKGKVLIDGIEINDISEKSLRNSIYIVHQQSFMFNLSIIDNFKMVKPNISIDEIIDICNLVDMHEYIMSLHNQYDTVIEENTSNLSGGQKQRLSLAMCLVKNTPIILLDEVTSALDIQSKEMIEKIIKDISKTKTVIVITHDISTIKKADEIILFNKNNSVNIVSNNWCENSDKNYWKSLVSTVN
ncbi:ABC transporter ATP-binding protein [uncultured Clostridium sp.]|uniref:ABC transporter ATP-binding protein n=1 Tax=uncultured Clostridium sp. TaxID=59620 RepID=UPI003216D1B5